MNVSRIDGFKEEMHNATESMKTRISEVQGKVEENINKAMVVTADSLENTAKKFNGTAEVLREKNAQTIKNDVSELVKKYPAYTFVGAMVIGFIFGKMLSKR
ncbi:MAG: hypothetical protein WCK67_03700 [bacterium]